MHPGELYHNSKGIILDYKLAFARITRTCRMIYIYIVNKMSPKLTMLVCFKCILNTKACTVCLIFPSLSFSEGCINGKRGFKHFATYGDEKNNKENI